MEVHVKDAARQRVVGHFLDQRQLIFLGVFDLQLDENLFTHAVGEQGQDGFAVQADHSGRMAFAIDDGRDESFFTQALEGTSAGTFAGVSGKWGWLGHDVCFGMDGCLTEGEPCVRSGLKQNKRRTAGRVCMKIRFRFHRGRKGGYLNGPPALVKARTALF